TATTRIAAAPARAAATRPPKRRSRRGERESVERRRVAGRLDDGLERVAVRVVGNPGSRVAPLRFGRERRLADALVGFFAEPAHVLARDGDLGEQRVAILVLAALLERVASRVVHVHLRLHLHELVVHAVELDDVAVLARLFLEVLDVAP